MAPNDEVRTKVAHALATSSGQFFCKMFFNGKPILCHIDSGAEVSVFPMALLSPDQKSKITPSNISVVAYGEGKINNSGEFRGDFDFEGLEKGQISRLKNLRFLITNSSMTPLLGTQMCFLRVAVIIL